MNTYDYFNAAKGAFYGRDSYIEINAEPGHEYIVRGKEENTALSIWVEDVDTGNIVFGDKKN